jgi:hypothetical protein
MYNLSLFHILKHLLFVIPIKMSAVYHQHISSPVDTAMDIDATVVHFAALPCNCLTGKSERGLKDDSMLDFGVLPFGKNLQSGGIAETLEFLTTSSYVIQANINIQQSFPMYEVSSEPIRPILTHEPPKRFFRTFWIGLIRRLWFRTKRLRTEHFRQTIQI